MPRRVRLVVPVVGALLVGSVVTGTTRASWVDQADLAAATTRSGAMSFTGSATPASLTVPEGGSKATRLTITDTSDAAAKNLRQRISTNLSSVPSGMSATLTVTGSGSTCGTGAQGAVTLSPSGTVTTCVNVSAGSASVGSSSSLSVLATGVQVRGGTVLGWTSPNRTITIPVTVGPPVPTPTLGCSPGRVPGNNFEFSWSAVSGATEYTVLESTTTNSTGAYAALATLSTTSYRHTSFPDGATRFFRVTATTSAGTSAHSNTIRVVRNGSGGNAYDCTVVTP